MPKGPLVHITKEEFEELYINQRLSCRQISIIYNCAESTMFYHQKKLGIKKRSVSDIPMDDEKFKSMVNGGLSRDAIAKHFRITTVTVANHLKRLGMKTNVKKVEYNHETTWDKELVADVIKEPTLAKVKRIVKAKYKVGSKLKGYKIVKYYPDFVQTESKYGGLVGFTYSDVWKENLREEKED